MSFTQAAAPGRELLGSQGAAGVREWIGQIIIVNGSQQEFTHHVYPQSKEYEEVALAPKLQRNSISTVTTLVSTNFLILVIGFSGVAEGLHYCLEISMRLSSLELYRQKGIARSPPARWSSTPDSRGTSWTGYSQTSWTTSKVLIHFGRQQIQY